MNNNHLRFKFRLYVADDTHNSAQAIANLRAICVRYMPDHHEIEIIDVFKEPERALADGILMTPTLVKVEPMPEQRIVGVLSDISVVLRALGLEPLSA